MQPVHTTNTTSTTAALPDQISDSQMQRYSELIYSKTGIRISLQKKTLLSNRLKRRLRETGINSYDAYFEILKKLTAADAEWDAFLQEITTHETYLYRDQVQWDWFQKEFLPEVAAAQQAGQRDKTLRIWSAACSTGDEAYTIASSIATCLPNYQQWQVQIVGTDIGIGAVEAARQALFNERAMRLVPDKIKQNCFGKLPGKELWQPRPALSKMVTFRTHNLMQPLNEKPFDLVFLKNVLIYFDADSKAVVMSHLKKLIKPSGYLVAEQRGYQ